MDPHIGNRHMKRRFLGKLGMGTLAALALAGASLAQTTDEAPDALVKRLSTDVLESIKADKSIQSGDIAKVVALVESKIMPNVNFERMTASAVGPGWRQATPEQKKRLQDEFKILLVRTYAGALAQVNDQTISMKPLRASPGKNPGTGCRLENLQPERSGRMAGGNLSQSIRPGNQCQGY